MKETFLSIHRGFQVTKSRQASFPNILGMWPGCARRIDVTLIKLKKRGVMLLGVFLIISAIFPGCTSPQKTPDGEQANLPETNGEAAGSTQTAEVRSKGSPTLYYLAHASVKIKTSDGIVIYIDPAFGEDYSEPADIVLVTHFHADHSDIDKISTAKKYRLIRPDQALIDGVYQKFDLSGIKVEAVPAYNSNHSVEDCVGYVLEFDGIKLYHAGDTSKIKEMADLADKNITYALLPMDAVYNMGPEEAAECAGIIKAKHYIPIHTGPDGIFSQENVDKFNVDNKIVLQPGSKLELEK